MTFRVIAEARDELLEIASYYEDQSEGLGFEFVEAFWVAAGLIATHPEGFRSFPDGYRRFLMSRFPYGIFYRIKEETIDVAFIVHLHSDPSKWSELLRNR